MVARLCVNHRGIPSRGNGQWRFRSGGMSPEALAKGGGGFWALRAQKTVGAFTPTAFPTKIARRFIDARIRLCYSPRRRPLSSAG